MKIREPRNIAKIMIVLLILLAGALVINGCEQAEPRTVRERIAFNANADSWVRWGNDIIFYSDDRSTQKIALEGSAGNIDAEGTLDVAGAVTFSGGVSAAYITGTVTITGLDITAGDDVLVMDTLDVDGDIDLDGDGFDVDITGGASIDADAASNLNTSAGDITIEAEVASVVIKADEATDDAIVLDADEAAGTGVSITVGSSGGLFIGGGLTDIGGGTGGTADGDNDLLVAADAEVDGVLDVDGSVDVDGTGVDVDVSASVSIDADTASNFSTSAQDITIEAETGSIIIKADEAIDDALWLDADEAAGTGISITVGSSGGLFIGGGLTDIGLGTYATANGDNDLGVAGDLEVDGATDLDGTLSVASTVTLQNAEGFDNATNGQLDLQIDATTYVSMTTTGLYLEALELFLDADSDTSITADTDAQIDVKVDGTDVVSVTATGLYLEALEIFLDVDSNTSITADTNDQVDIKVDGSDVISVTASGFYIEGVPIYIDGDSDTSITADTDDQVDIAVGGTDVVSVTATGFYFEALEVFFDADSDTSITADTDDQIDIKIAGADDFQFTANTFTAQAGSTITTPTAIVGRWQRYARSSTQVATDGFTLTPTGTYQQLSSAGGVGFSAITVSTAGDLLILTNISATTITITDTGTTMLSANRALSQYDTLTLLCDGTNWLELSFTDN